MQENRPSVRALFASSARELRKARTIAISGMLLSAQIVLASYGALFVTNSLRISLDHLALAPTAMLFGPVVAGVQGALCDILAYLLRPSGPYFPLFTLSKLLSGIFYGLAFYKARPTAARIVSARLAVVIGLNILLNTLFLTMLYGPSYMATLPVRALKSLIQCPIDCLLLAAVLRIMTRLPRLGDR